MATPPHFSLSLLFISDFLPCLLRPSRTSQTSPSSSLEQWPPPPPPPHSSRFRCHPPPPSRSASDGSPGEGRLFPAVTHAWNPSASSCLWAGILKSPMVATILVTMAKLLLANSVEFFISNLISSVKVAFASSSASKHVYRSVAAALYHVRRSSIPEASLWPPPSFSLLYENTPSKIESLTQKSRILISDFLHQVFLNECYSTDPQQWPWFLIMFSTWSHLVWFSMGIFLMRPIFVKLIGKKGKVISVII